MIFTQNPTLITGKIYQLLQITLRRTFTQNVKLKKKMVILKTHILCLKKNSIVESLFK